MKKLINLGALLAGGLLLPSLVAAQTPAVPVKPSSGKAVVIFPGSNLKKVASSDQSANKPLGVDETTRAQVNRFYADLDGLTPKQRELQEQRINLHLDDVPILKAFEQVFTQTRTEKGTSQLAIDGDVPMDKHVTIHADNIRFGTALDLLCEAGGVHYRQEDRNGKLLYHVGKTVKPSSALSISLRDTFRLPSGAQFEPLPPDKLNVLKEFPQGGGVLYRALAGEKRSTFTCPHCHAQTTIIRHVHGPACPKCGRTFQSDWQFCPTDGTKRPADIAQDWKYCPVCGKRVEIEKGDVGEVDENKIPVLGDIPLIGPLFRTKSRADLKPGAKDLLRDPLQRTDPNLQPGVKDPPKDPFQPGDPNLQSQPDPTRELDLDLDFTPDSDQPAPDTAVRK